MSEQLISIAMAAFNGEMFIREQIESILAQTYGSFELIIVDDCSGDGTFQIAEEYAKKDSRIRVCRNAENLGFIRNFEKAISLCRAEYIALADQDDIWTADHLETLMTMIGDNDLACANSKLINDSGNSMGRTMRDVLDIKSLPFSREEYLRRLAYATFVQGSAILFRRRQIPFALPMPESVVYHDRWLGLAAAVNNGIIYSDKVILEYRQHQTNVTTNEKMTFFRKLQNFLNVTNTMASYRYSIILCEELLKKEMRPEDRKVLEESAEYFRYRLSGKNKWKAFRYFSRYYNVLYMTDTNEKKLQRLALLLRR